jgi:hypothetical protein
MDVGNWVILSILLGYKFRACVLYMLVGVGETKNGGVSTHNIVGVFRRRCDIVYVLHGRRCV